MKGRTIKKKGYRGRDGYNQGGQLSRVPKPPLKTGKTSGQEGIPPVPHREPPVPQP